MKLLAWLGAILHVILVAVVAYAIWELIQVFESLRLFLGRN